MNIIKPFIVRTIWLCIAIFGSATTSAYSISNHERLTRSAVDLLEYCAVPIHQALEDHLVKMNVKQDDLHRKPILWHFPPPIRNDRLDESARAKSWSRPFASWLVLRTDFGLWTDYLHSTIENATDDPDILSAAGALLHFVQDMVVPAHAIPVFHPAGFTLKSDGFDDWSIFHDFQFSSADCNAVKATRSIATILEDNRLTTLERIGMLEGEVPKWGKHWTFAHTDKGFGEYHCGSDAFGTDGGLNCDDALPHLTREDFIEAATPQARLAVVSSAKVIFYALKQAKCAPDKCNDWGDVWRNYLVTTKRIERLMGRR
ncbi:MAG: hypothetical protein C9356_15030 [Oleiphilus sp.]|nr:MAG: hypothetical protein C9356_15030 [Oleiphilus sp.]